MDKDQVLDLLNNNRGKRFHVMYMGTMDKLKSNTQQHDSDNLYCVCGKQPWRPTLELGKNLPFTVCTHMHSSGLHVFQKTVRDTCPTGNIHQNAATQTASISQSVLCSLHPLFPLLSCRGLKLKAKLCQSGHQPASIL